MKNKFTDPELDIIMFDINDIIRTSGKSELELPPTELFS